MNTFNFLQLNLKPYAFLNGGYDLIVIEDGDVPLASGVRPVNYYIFMVAILLLAALVVAFLFWLTKRSDKKKRLLELWSKQGSDKKVPFLIRNINSAIEEAELELAASML